MQPRERGRFSQGSAGENHGENHVEARLRPHHGQLSASDDESIHSSEKPTKTQKLRALSSKTKEKTKKSLAMNKKPTVAEKDGLSIIECDSAFNSNALAHQKPASRDGSIRKARKTLQSIATAVVHPKEAIKSKATRATAGKLSIIPRPYLSQKADLDFLDAHNDLDRANSSRSSRKASADDDEDSLSKNRREKVQDLEAYRESLSVRWTTSNVGRARVVPKRHLKFPNRSGFAERDAQGNPVRYDWLKWLGHNLIYYTQDFSAQYIDDFDELPFDIDYLRHHVERLVMASAPWQSWAMNVRSVYRWDSPQTTGKWFALYLLLFYTEHIVGFLWLYIIYLVTKNRYFPTSVGSLRDSTQRARDNQSTAYKFGELIDKHGREKWLGPLIDELGPYIQLQLGDVANMLEVFNNFYHWKSPRKTAASLSFFATCLLVSVFADMAYCMRIFWFIAGGAFFLCWPIASLYPKYRYLVSPFKWVLWDIPTNAEWSFQYLRRQAQASRERMIQGKVQRDFLDETAYSLSGPHNNQYMSMPQTAAVDSSTDDNDDDWHSVDSSTSVLDASDILAFRASSQNKRGRFMVYSGGVRFVQSLTKEELWRRTFLELAEMRKVKGSFVPKLTMKPREQLELKFIDGDIMLLEGMKDQNEAFNAVIGFSSLQWQALQPLQD